MSAVNEPEKIVAAMRTLRDEDPITAAYLAASLQRGESDLLEQVLMQATSLTKFASFADLVATDFPQPQWVVEGLLPVGLTILAGPPKRGKSWLALLLAQAVAAGGRFLGRKASQGRVLYIALEDPPRRLKDRTLRQGWSQESLQSATPMFADEFRAKFGGKNGAADFASFVEEAPYTLVVIDTLSRAFGLRDWNDLAQVTAILAPIQEAASRAGKAVVLIDHHRKPLWFAEDVVNDVIGSIAKGAVADCLWGFYKDQGKRGARLLVEGRDVEEQSLELLFDGVTGCWQEAAPADILTEAQRTTISAVETFDGGATLSELAVATGRNRGTLSRELQRLQNLGFLTCQCGRWRRVSEESLPPAAGSP